MAWRRGRYESGAHVSAVRIASLTPFSIFLSLVILSFVQWERRTPLIPSDVAKLTQQGVRVLVQPSSMRIYKDAEFKAVRTHTRTHTHTHHMVVCIPFHLNVCFILFCFFVLLFPLLF